MEQPVPELLVHETRQFDTTRFYTDYNELNWRDQTLRHIGHHIVKAGYKLIDYDSGTGSIEKITGEVIPDLAIYQIC